MRSTTKTGMGREEIGAFFETLGSAWGPQHWWPAETPFEVIVGAILTQNTAWSNVEKALQNMRKAGLLSVQGVRGATVENLEQMIRPAGYFRQKTKRLKTVVAWLDDKYGGSIQRMFARPTAELRVELLGINGIGPETADSILLYAGQHEVFVVDAYTRRIFERHRIIKAGAKYDEIRVIVEASLQAFHQSTSVAPPSTGMPSVEPGPGPAEEVLTPMVHPPSPMSETPRGDLAQRYNEFHALLVQAAKHYCQSRVARCEACPLRLFLASGRPFLNSKVKRAKLKKPSQGETFRHITRERADL